MVEIQPEEIIKRDEVTNMFENYDDTKYLATAIYFSKIETIFAIAFQKMGYNNAPPPETKEKIKGLGAHFTIYNNIGFTINIRKKLLEYLSEQEMLDKIYNKKITEKYLRDLLAPKVPEPDKLSNIVRYVIKNKRPMRQITIYSKTKAVIIQERNEFICYKTYTKHLHEKLVIQKGKVIEGEEFTCVLKEEDSYEAYDVSGNKIGLPQDFFEKVIEMLKE